jgi:hypothetical protein
LNDDLKLKNNILLKMFIRLVTLCALIVGSFASIKDCDPSSVFRPTQLAISPDPPIPGQAVKLTLIFDNTGDEISEGTVTTSISINAIPVSPSKVSLCENTACPITHGVNDRSTEITFPSVTGIIKSHVTWTGPKGESLLCIDSSLKVTGASSWNPFSLIQDSYLKSKNTLDKMFNKFKELAEENNLRGMLDEINHPTTKAHQAEEEKVHTESH